MRILGIDPGYAIVGFGLVDALPGTQKLVACGAINTPSGVRLPARLWQIATDLEELIGQFSPDVLAIEELFFNSNHTTAIPCAEARGVILLAAKQKGLDIFEYTPLQVKQSVTGYGRAVKKQVQEMTRIILNLESIPKPDDTADALAMAICHAHCSGSLLGSMASGL